MASLQESNNIQDKPKQSRVSKVLFRYILPTCDEGKKMAPGIFWTILSAILARTAFPETEWAWAAWVCLVPFLHQLRRSTPKEGAWLGFIFGMVFFYLNLTWLNELKFFTPVEFLAYLAPVGMALICSLSTILFGALTAIVMPRQGWLRFFFIPALWTSIEFLRSLSELAFPWMYLAHTQVNHNLLIQICDITGVFGLTFIIVLVNLAIADTYRMLFRERTPEVLKQLIPRWSVALLAILLILGYGARRTHNLPAIPDREEKGTESFRVALIQPGIKQTQKQESTARVTPETLEIYVKEGVEELKAQGMEGEDLNVRETELRQRVLQFAEYIQSLRALLDQGISRQIIQVIKECSDNNIAKPDLYILPETAFTNPDFNSSPTSLKSLRSLAEDVAKAPILFGADRSEKIKGQEDEHRMYNSVYIARPETGVDLENVYDKMHLVPFGEYSSYFRIIPNFTKRFLGMLDFSWGTEPKIFNVQDRTFAPLICFESCFPYLFRKYEKLNPDCMVVQTNDAWYGVSSGAYRHKTQSIFRAIETRRPLIRVANTGISCIIDPWGRTYAELPLVASGPKQISWPLLFRPDGMKDHHSLYMRLGDWFAILCLLFNACVLYQTNRNRTMK